MIHAASLTTASQTSFTNGAQSAIADIPLNKGGQGLGFGPHDLMEAALATCMTMTVQKYAHQHDMPLEGVDCQVTVDRSLSDRVTFHYSLTLRGQLRPEQSHQLREAAVKCPVAKTLSGDIAIRSIQ